MMRVMLEERARHIMNTDGGMKLIFGLALYLLLGVDASAQNLVPNPNFDTDLSGWVWFGQPITYVDQDGSPTPGAAEVYNQYQFAGMASACFAIDPTQEYVASAMVKLMLGYSSFFQAVIFVGPNCEGDGTWAAGAGFGQPAGNWISLNGGTVSIPDNSFGSARMYFLTSGYTGDLVSFDVDSVYFGPNSIFASGFDN